MSIRRYGPIRKDSLSVYEVGPYYGPWGSGNDQVAIQNTLDAARQAGGGRVVLPFTGSYTPKASQLVIPRWVTFSGASWNSFGASGPRLEQLSGVNDDFIIFNDNGDGAARPFVGPCSVTDLVIRAASGTTAGHGINMRTKDTVTGVAVTNAGTTGSTTYYYRVSAVYSGNEGDASAEASTSTGAATLSTTDYNIITWNTITSATSFNIYRSTTSNAEVRVATGVTGNSFNDQGATATATPYPATSAARFALVQDFSQFARLGVRGFAGSGIYIRGGSPTYIEKVETEWNGGYGVEIIDTAVDVNNWSVHQLILSDIGGDGNMGYASDAGGATVYIKGVNSQFGVSLRGIKSEYRIRPVSDSGDGVVMGNAYCVVLDNCSCAIDITGVQHIATGSQTRKPKAGILVKGASRPDLSWAAVGVRGNHPLQTVGEVPPIVQDDVDSVSYFATRGDLGAATDAAVPGLSSGESTLDRRTITSTGAAQTAGALRLTYFTAQKTETIAAVRTLSGSTAAAGTTLARIGVYSVAANGDLTLLASTVSDTALWSATSTAYGKNFTTTFVKRKNTRYAVGTLAVGSTTAANLIGQTQLLQAECARPPRLCGFLTGQTDLPTSILGTAVQDSTIQIYAALSP